MATTMEKLAVSAEDYFAAKLGYEMSPWTLKQKIENGKDAEPYYVLDVRDAETYKQGHIPGAKNIPLQELASKSGSLPKDKTIVTYCGNFTCQLAPKAALELARKGFQVMELHGGWAEWQAKGGRVEK